MFRCLQDSRALSCATVICEDRSLYSGYHSLPSSQSNTTSLTPTPPPHLLWCNTQIYLFFFFSVAQVRNCRLSSLLDLALDKDYVRSKIAEYMNNLIDMGVAGFRIDAAKHMWPGDIKAFLDKLHNLNTQWFSEGTRPFIYQEVIFTFSPLYLSFVSLLLPPSEEQQHSLIQLTLEGAHNLLRAALQT